MKRHIIGIRIPTSSYQIWFVGNIVFNYIGEFFGSNSINKRSKCLPIAAKFQKNYFTIIKRKKFGSFDP